MQPCPWFRQTLAPAWILAMVLATVSAAEPLAATNAEQAVRRAYERLSAYVEWPGNPKLEVKLYDFEFIGPENFSELPFRDLATLTERRTLAVVKTSYFSAEEDIEYARYLATWKDGVPSVMRAPEGAAILTISADEAFAQMERQDRQLKVEAITRFKVRLDFDGQSADYTAAFLWFDSDHSSFQVVDYVMEGVDEAFHDSRPTIYEARMNRRQRVSAN